MKQSIVVEHAGEPSSVLFVDLKGGRREEEERRGEGDWRMENGQEGEEENNSGRERGRGKELEFQFF